MQLTRHFIGAGNNRDKTAVPCPQINDIAHRDQPESYRLHYHRKRPAAIGHFAHDANARGWRRVAGHR